MKQQIKMDKKKKINFLVSTFSFLKKDQEFSKELGIDIFFIREKWVVLVLEGIVEDLHKRLESLIAVRDELDANEEDDVSEKIEKLKEFIKTSEEVKTYEEFTEFKEKLKRLKIKA